MILPFKTKINGKPTYFVEKIIAGLYRNGIIDDRTGKSLIKEYFTFVKEPLPSPVFYKGSPKIHTIREDKHNRWQVGKMIDFYINNRTKKAFCFAPRVPVTNIQTIKLDYAPSFVYLYIDNECVEAARIDDGGIEYLFRSLSTEGDCPIMHSLAINDGFGSITEFLNYFYPYERDGTTCFEGKIIHWTDLKY